MKAREGRPRGRVRQLWLEGRTGRQERKARPPGRPSPQQPRPAAMLLLRESQGTQRVDGACRDMTGSKSVPRLASNSDPRPLPHRSGLGRPSRWALGKGLGSAEVGSAPTGRLQLESTSPAREPPFAGAALRNLSIVKSCNSSPWASTNPSILPGLRGSVCPSLKCECKPAHRRARLCRTGQLLLLLHANLSWRVTAPHLLRLFIIISFFLHTPCHTVCLVFCVLWGPGRF